MLSVSMVLDFDMLSDVLDVDCFSASQGVGIWGAMYDIVGPSSLAPSYDRIMSCSPLADSLGA